MLAQSQKGWTNVKLVTAYIQLQLDHPDVSLGKGRPKVINWDGHSAHIYN